MITAQDSNSRMRRPASDFRGLDNQPAGAQPHNGPTYLYQAILEADVVSSRSR
jgi:hypothetical protein